MKLQISGDPLFRRTNAIGRPAGGEATDVRVSRG
jgi:hypothetical protein